MRVRENKPHWFSFDVQEPSSFALVRHTSTSELPFSIFDVLHVC